MKLLMISGDRSILQGKKGAFWYTLEELAKHWERIDVITPRAEDREQRTENRGQRTEDRANPFSNVFFHPSPRGLWYQPWWILMKGDELITEHHHDVMTVHEYPPFYNGLGARWLHRSKKIPYMTEIHHVVGFPKAASLSERIGYLLSKFWLPRWGANSAKAVRVVSEGTQKLLQTWGIRSLALLPSLYLDRNALQSDSTIPKEYDFVFCGRLVANKQLSNVLHALKDLPGVSLLVIGDGPERKRCENLAVELGINDRVTFDGWLHSQEDVYRAMQSARILIMNSASEGGPRVVFEAMALGMPVITTNVGMVPQFVRDGVNGIITSGDPDDLREKISALISDAQKREQIGHQARAVIDAFDRSLLIKNYADALKRLSALN